ncbi:MAG: hypothetical protein J0I20_27785 [Chloroflexi bacterium]|nr:hypothetical protein [Chloroflexota bacterium]OJV95872.1 MAG: hypothetical protein BGO39_21435 [Chloroflexi bacterium 54-19]
MAEKIVEQAITKGQKAGDFARSDNKDWWDRQNQNFFKNWTELASGKGGVALVFGWAVAEATFWPVIPDFVLAPLAAVNQQKSLRLLAASACGSALGSLLLFAFTRRNPAKTRALLKKLPLVHAYHFEQIEHKLTKDWSKTLLMQPWSGVPAKIVVAVGAEKSLLDWWKLPLLMLSRTVRMALVVGIARVAGRVLRRPLCKSSLVVFFLYLIFFIPVWWQIVKDRSKNLKKIPERKLDSL